MLVSNAPIESREAAGRDLADRYLDLLARTLTRVDAGDDFRLQMPGANRDFARRQLGKAINHILTRWKLEAVRRVPFDLAKRTDGLDWPMHADTMVGLKRLENIRNAVHAIVTEPVPGDLIETGVWRGGASIMMRAALEAYGDRTRTVWCADSFEGLPVPDIDRCPQDAGGDWHTHSYLAVSLEQVQRNFQKYGLLDDRVRFLKGWFKDTLHDAPIDRISILRLDGDMYASTMDVLNPLYDKVSSGGFVIIDDYGIDVCRQAVNDFRSARGITEPIFGIDHYGSYWRKA